MKLQSSQTSRYRIKSLVQVWRRIELQGSQTHFCPNRRFEKFRRRKKLQGFQTEYHNARQRRLEGGRNYMVLKLEKLFRMLHCGFGRREITWLKPDFLMCRWISSLEGWITWYSNAQKYTGNNEFGLEEDEITGYSNGKNLHIAWFYGLEEDITWYSNRGVPLQAGVFGLEEDKITWYSNTDFPGCLAE